MKKLQYKGYTFHYQVKEYDCGEYGVATCYTTIFYEYLGKGVKKKYWLWGPEVKYDIHKELFTLQYNIESCGITKIEIRRDLDKEIDLMFRCEEIKKGEIV